MTQNGLNDEIRFEMTMRAAGRERRNRPRALLVLAGAALVVGGLAALTGVGARSRAASAFQEQLETSAKAESLLAEYARLKQTEQVGSDEAHRELPFLLTRVEDAALRAGLQNKPAPPTQQSTDLGAVVVRKYVYQNVRSEKLEPLIQWLRQATQDVPGLEVYQITSLRPEPNAWTMAVVFRRWEVKSKE